MSRPASFSTVAVALLATAALALAAGCGGSEEEAEQPPQETTPAAESAQAPQAIDGRGEFSVCMDVSFPPMEYYESPGSEEPVGFDVDAVRLVAERWGVEPKFVPTEFTGLLPGLAAGKCDAVWSAIFITPERTEQFPAVPYYKSRRVFLVRGGNPAGIKGPEGLDGKTVATEAGTKYVDQLQELDKQLETEGGKGLNLQTYPKASDAVQQLVVGRADAVLTQDTEAAFRMTQQPGTFEIAYIYPESDVFGVYYRREDTELSGAIEQALADLKEDGALTELAEKYGLPADGLEVE